MKIFNRNRKKAGQLQNCPAVSVQEHTAICFAPSMSESETAAFSALALAHIGDGVYELMTRTALARSGITSAAQLHRETVRRVNAPVQAKAAAALSEYLTEAEAAVMKRGRNAKVHGIPQHANPAEYHAATGLEALFGWLWLQGKTERLSTLFHILSEVL